MCFSRLQQAFSVTLNHVFERRPLSKLISRELPTLRVHAGNWSRDPGLSLRSANGVPQAISTYLGTFAPPESISVVEGKRESVNSHAEVTSAIGRLFDGHGSDKTRHGYDVLYQDLLDDFGDRRISILEVGIGTNKPNAVSSMGALGTPGAALLAFSDLPQVEKVVGLDIDDTIFFEHTRIEFFRLNQRSSADWERFLSWAKDTRFDLIIDDGLHSFEASLLTMSYAQGLLTDGGVFLVEDVQDAVLPAWQMVFDLNRHLESPLDLSVFRADRANVVIGRKQAK